MYGWAERAPRGSAAGPPQGGSPLQIDIVNAPLPHPGSCAGVKHEVAIRGGAAVRQGHLAAIKEAVGLHAITDVILNFSTTASHLSRISQAVQPTLGSSKQSIIPVIVKDRTGVVLDIFRKHALSAEAHLQVRLAGTRPLPHALCAACHMPSLVHQSCHSCQTW